MNSYFFRSCPAPATDRIAPVIVERHRNVPPAAPLALDSNERSRRVMDAQDFEGLARRECDAYPQRSATSEQHRQRLKRPAYALRLEGDLESKTNALSVATRAPTCPSCFSLCSRVRRHYSWPRENSTAKTHAQLERAHPRRPRLVRCPSRSSWKFPQPMGSHSSAEHCLFAVKYLISPFLANSLIFLLCSCCPSLPQLHSLPFAALYASGSKGKKVEI